MKKYLFILLLTIAGYGQTYQNPTYGTIKTKTSPTVTSVNHLATVEADGTIAKIDPVSLPFQNKRLVQNPIYYKEKEIHWFGDSYTSGSGASPTSNRFTTLVSSALGAIEVNHGVAGTTMQKRVPINYMASPNMVDNVANIPNKTASVAMLVFAYGLNDMGQTAPDYNVANYKTDYQFVLNNAFSKGWIPSQILIIPAYYIGTAGYAAYATITGNAAPTQARHLSFIQAAKEIAETNGTMYFDIYQDQVKNDITLIDPDNIHPTNAGYEYIANDVLQYLGQDKLSITTNTGYSSGGGFIGKINGNRIDNSFMYQNSSGIGIATLNPKTALQIHSTLSGSFMSMSNTTTTDGYGRGVLFELSGLDFRINNREAGGFNFYTSNANRGGFKSDGRFEIITGLTGVTYGITAQTNGSFSFGNSRSMLQAPTFSGKSSDGTGITMIAGTTDANTGGDIIIDARTTTETDFTTMSRTALKITRFNNALLTLLRSGDMSITGKVTAGSPATVSNDLMRKGETDTALALKANLASPTFTGDPTAPTPTAGDNDTSIPTTAFVTGAIATSKPYKVYVALISQTGTSAPTVIVLENTLGGTPVWSRIGPGVYSGLLSGFFTANKTTVIFTKQYTVPTGGTDIFTAVGCGSINSIDLSTANTAGLVDGVLSKATIEVRVYN